MKRIYCIVYACIVFNNILPKNIAHRLRDVNTLVENIWGRGGLRLDEDRVAKIRNMIGAIEQENAYQLNKVVDILIEHYKAAANKLAIEIQTLQKADNQILVSTFYKKFLLDTYLSYYESYQHTLEEKISSIGRVLGAVRYVLSSYDIDQLAEEIIEYQSFEQDDIFFNYDKLLMYFVSIDKYHAHIPGILNVWVNTTLQDQVRRRARKVSFRIQPQFLSALLDIAFQSVAMAGGQLATEMVDEEDQQDLKAAQEEAATIQQQWEEFKKNLDEERGEIIEGLIASLATSFKKVKAEYNVSNEQFKQEITYLNRSIPANTVKDNFVVNPLFFDQNFKASIMHTPDRIRWYNLFRVRNGDWEFDADTNSFWQNGLAPFEEIAQTEEGTTFTINPFQNSIFCEYTANEISYDIEVDCLLIHTSYPFFAGIMVNVGRWISGVIERITSYRLLGLYGIETVPGDKTSRVINIAFAEQKLFKASGDTKITINAPLDIIRKDPKTYITALPQETVNSLIRNPLQLTFKIKVLPTAVQLSVVKKEKKDDGSIAEVNLVDTTIEQLDQYVALFDGIGFMAPGCQAQFTIKKPDKLVYTRKEIVSFQQE